MRENIIEATITEVWWSVDLGDEVTPMLHIVLPDKTEIVLRDQIANGWTVERMTLGEGVDLSRILHGEEDNDSFYARYGDDAEFDFDTLRQVRRTLMQKGSEFFKEGYAQSIELRNVKQSALQPRQKRG